MSEQEIYGAEQEFNRFETIMNTQEYLTKEEYDFCFAWDKDIREDTSYIGDSNGAYLNLRLYISLYIKSCNCYQNTDVRCKFLASILLGCKISSKKCISSL